ncbi:MAG: hypothetical protein ACTSXH_07975 [Promethearchaeota archaeon]
MFEDFSWIDWVSCFRILSTLSGFLYGTFSVFYNPYFSILLCIIIPFLNIYSILGYLLVAIGIIGKSFNEEE